MLAIKNGKAITVTAGIIEKATILVEDRKIVAVGENLAVPDGTEVYNAEGKWVTPGLIDVHTHISTFNEPRDLRSHVDGNEKSNPITPHLRGIDALNPHDIAIKAAREAGFTTCYTGPGSANLIGGTGIAFKCRNGKTTKDIVLPGTEMMKMALGQNPINMSNANDKYLTTRMGNSGRLRETLAQARRYMESIKQGERIYDFQLEALLPLLRKEMKARIHCHRADDIVTAIRIAHEFDFHFTLEHATEGWKITEFLSENQITCVLGPLLMEPYKAEVWDCKQTTPAVFEVSGIPFCLTADAASATKWLPTHVGIAIRYGLSEAAAFSSVTINSARLLGLEDRMGSIETGKDADIAVFNGHPFLNTTQCVATMIDGTWEYMAS